MSIDYPAVSLYVGDPTNTLIGTAQIFILSDTAGTATLPLAAATARAIAGGFASSVTKKSGDVSKNSSDLFKHYMDLAKDLDRQVVTSGMGATSIYAGGISISDKETQEADTDRVQPAFTRELHSVIDLTPDPDDDGYGN